MRREGRTWKSLVGIYRGNDGVLRRTTAAPLRPRRALLEVLVKGRLRLVGGSRLRLFHRPGPAVLHDGSSWGRDPTGAAAGCAASPVGPVAPPAGAGPDGVGEASGAVTGALPERHLPLLGHPPDVPDDGWEGKEVSDGEWNGMEWIGTLACAHPK